MPKRSRTPTDPNMLAAHIVEQATGTTKRRKNPATVALGRRGGLKGGKARAAALTKDERVAIAKRAAKARWKDAKKEQ